MCSVMMRMRLETDFSAEDLAKKTRKSLDFVQTQCDKLVKAGVIRTRVRSVFSPTASSATRTPNSARVLRSIPASASACSPRCSATA